MGAGKGLESVGKRQVPLDAFSIDIPILTGLVSVTNPTHSSVMPQAQRPKQLIKQSDNNGDEDRDGNEQPLLAKPDFLVVSLENGNHSHNAHDHPDKAKDNKERKWDVLHVLCLVPN